jgi:hypothetical protein
MIFQIFQFFQFFPRILQLSSFLIFYFINEKVQKNQNFENNQLKSLYND